MTDLVGERAFDDVTVRELCARADVGYATFFRHYADKEALLFDVAELLMSDTLQLLAPFLGRRDTSGVALALCGFVRAREPLCRAVLAGGAEDTVRAELVRRAIANVSALNPHEHADPLRELAVFHSVSATLNLLAWWLRTHAEIDARAMAEHIDQLVLRPTVALRGG